MMLPLQFIREFTDRRTLSALFRVTRLYEFLPLGQFFVKITEAAQKVGQFDLKESYVLILTKMGRATFWAISLKPSGHTGLICQHTHTFHVLLNKDC
jgi:hypothetical protein